MRVLGFHVVTPVSICVPTLQMRKESPVIVPGPEGLLLPQWRQSSEPGVCSGHALLPTEKPEKAQTKAGSQSLGAQPLRQTAAPLRRTPSQSKPRPHSRVTQPVDSWDSGGSISEPVVSQG